MGLTLVDTSAWIEYLRMTGSTTNHQVRSMVAEGNDIATCDVVIMELLCGTKTADEWNNIWALMNRFQMLPVRPLFDYEVAGTLYRQCRQQGFTPANSNDLLISAVAIGKDVPVVAADTDFERIAQLSSLRVA
jgi:hypothetical protein